MKNLTVIIVSILLCTMIKYMATSSEADHPTLSTMDILQNVLSDQEFLSLEKEKQLRLIILIYNILESRYKEQLGKFDKRFGKKEYNI
jgi:hypothetical protein